LSNVTAELTPAHERAARLAFLAASVTNR